METIREMTMHSLTDLLSLLGWEKHVDVVRVNGGVEVLVTVGQDGASGLELPSVDLESRKIRVGGGGRDLPGDVPSIGVRVGSEPVEEASISRMIDVRRLKGKAIDNGLGRRVTTENSADNTRTEIVRGPTRSQAKQARDLAAVH